MNGSAKRLFVVDHSEKLSFGRIKREEVGRLRHPIGYVSYSVFKVSDL